MSALAMITGSFSGACVGVALAWWAWPLIEGRRRRVVEVTPDPDRCRAHPAVEDCWDRHGFYGLEDQ